MAEVGEPSSKESFLHRTGSSFQRKIMAENIAYNRGRKIWALQVAAGATGVILCSILLAIFLADHLGKGGKGGATESHTPAPKKTTTTTVAPPTTTTTVPKITKSEPINADDGEILNILRATTRHPHLPYPTVAVGSFAVQSEASKCQGKMRPKSSYFHADTTEELDAEPNNGNAAKQGQTTCRTVECYEIGNTLKRSMNTDVDHCKDFYQFACGNTPRVGKTSGQFQFAQSRQIQMELEILKSPQRTRDLKALTYAKTLYSKCLESGRPEQMQAQFQHIQDIPKNMLNITWPILAPISRQDFSKPTAELLRRLITLPVLLGVKYYVSGNSSNQWRWRLEPPTFLLTNPVLRNSLPAYTSFVAKVAKEFSLDRNASRGRFLPLASDIVDFELKLIQVLSSAQRSIHTHSVNVSISLGELDWLMPRNPTVQFSIKMFLKYLFFPDGTSELKDDEIITVFSMDYLKAITKLLGDTQSRTVANYLGYRLVMVLVPLATQTRSLLSDSERSFLPILEALTPYPTNFSACHSLVSNYFGWVLRRYSFANNFGTDAAIDVSNILTKIKTELKGRVERNGCLPRERLSQVVEELDKIEPCHNYVTNDPDVERYYEDLARKSEGGNYVEQIFKIFEHTNSAVFNFLRGNITTFPYCSAVSNGQMTIFYSKEDKKINVPPTYWREPFYYKSNYAALNFGGIGAIIGYEFMHGLLLAVPEWTDHKDGTQTTPATYNHFPDSNSNQVTTFLSSDCIIDQYARFHPSGRQQNGVSSRLESSHTFLENIADIGGVQLAFSAYRKFINENGQRYNQERLPGLETYSHEQLFFLKFAHIWCDKSSEFSKEMQSHSDHVLPHSPNEFRVWGSLQNNKDFARVWNCPVGTEMNPGPLKRCSIFD